VPLRQAREIRAESPSIFGKLDGPIDPKGGYLFANRLDWSPATLAFGAAGPCNKALNIKPRPCLGQWSRS